MRGRAFIPGVDDLHGAASVTEIPVSTPFVAIENKAPADRAHNLHGKTAAVGITTGQRTRPHTVSWLVNSIQHMFTLATILFFILPPSVFNLIGWHYIGRRRRVPKSSYCNLLADHDVHLPVADRPSLQGKCNSSLLHRLDADIICVCRWRDCVLRNPCQARFNHALRRHLLGCAFGHNRLDLFTGRKT